MKILGIHVSVDYIKFTSSNNIFIIDWNKATSRHKGPDIALEDDSFLILLDNTKFADFILSDMYIKDDDREIIDMDKISQYETRRDDCRINYRNVGIGSIIEYKIPLDDDTCTLLRFIPTYSENFLRG